MSQTPLDNLVAVARVEKTQGRRGEVSAEVLSDFPERFQPGREFVLSDGRSSSAMSLESSWFHKGKVVLKLQGIDSISAAETLIGAVLYIPRSERPALPPNSVYVNDVIGCSVLDGDVALGQVAGWENTGAAPLLRIETPSGEMLIPFVEEFLEKLDLENKSIHVRLPEGLKELNQTPEAKNPASGQFHSRKHGRARRR